MGRSLPENLFQDMATSTFIAVLAITLMCIYATDATFYRRPVFHNCLHGHWSAGLRRCLCNTGYRYYRGACNVYRGVPFVHGGVGNGGHGGNGGNGGFIGNGGSGGHGGNGGQFGNGGSGGNGGHAGQGQFGPGFRVGY